MPAEEENGHKNNNEDDDKCIQVGENGITKIHIESEQSLYILSYFITCVPLLK